MKAELGKRESQIPPDVYFSDVASIAPICVQWMPRAILSECFFW